MRIASLLPALTELVCALGRNDELVGVSHECDYPPGVESLPYLTRSRIRAEGTSAEIDDMVSAQRCGLYELEEEVLASLDPDLILTQEQCDVCAVNEVIVREAAVRLPGSPNVESFNPLDLEGVFAMFRRVGELLDNQSKADSLVVGFQLTAAEIARRHKTAAGQSSAPRVLLLEWLNPPFCCGHWNPEIIECAGGVEVLGQAGVPARRLTWKEVAASRPEVVIVAPCGFKLERAETELRAIENRVEWLDLPAVHSGRVVLVDGSAYFSRPSPRLEASLRIAAAAIDPDHCGDLAPPEGQGWLRWPVTR
jgi:iron complex transport system substrate-binding protein